MEPTAGPLPVCFDYGCKSTAEVTLEPAAWAQVRAVFSPVPLSAEAERQRIASAIALLETLTGEIVGTSADRGGNFEGGGEPFQMDCIDESTNTTTYLESLAADGLLRWHRVLPRERRMRWVIGIHWSAVSAETASGQRYVVDAWPRDNGLPPLIQPVEDWYAAERPGS